MRRLLLVALLAAVLATPTALGAASGARGPITVGAAVNDVAWGRDARFAAVTNDPGTSHFEPEETTWSLWTTSGALQNSGAFDDTSECPEDASPLRDDCLTPAQHVALSSDGTRMAIAGRISQQRGVLLQVINDAGTVLGQHVFAPNDGFDVTVNDLALSASGSRVAIALQLTRTDNTDGLLGVYDVGTTSLTPTFSDRTFSDAALAVDLSPDGAYVSVAAGAHYFYKLPSTDLYRHAQSGTTARDVDLSATDGWSVAGFANGFFALYNNEISQQIPREYQKAEPGETSSQDAVAIRDDATAFATGSAAGTVRLYSLNTSAAVDQAQKLAEKGGLGAIREMAFSADGRYLAVRSGSGTSNALRLYYTGNGALDEMWSDTRSAMGVHIAIDGRGEHVIASSGSTVLVYDAIHKLVLQAPSVNQASGTNATYTVTYTNDGNRDEAISLGSTPPAGVSVAISPSSFHLLPGASKQVEVTVSLATTRAPGTLSLPLTARLAGGTDGTKTDTMAITVPTVRDLDLEAVGATSLSIDPGQSKLFEAKAVNRGNVQETGALRVTGLPAGWTASVSPSSINLASGASTPVNVTLTAPASAAQLSQATARLERDGSTPLELTATVGAAFRARLTGPEGATLAPGVSKLVDLTLKNDGNAPDTFVVRIGNLPAGWTAGFLNGLNEYTATDLAPGATLTVGVAFEAPSDYASSVPVQVTMRAQSLGDPSQSSSKGLLLTVLPQDTGSETSSTTDGEGGGGGNGIPGPGLPLLLAGLGAVLALRRRRA